MMRITEIPSSQYLYASKIVASDDNYFIVDCDSTNDPILQQSIAFLHLEKIKKI